MGKRRNDRSQGSEWLAYLWSIAATFSYSDFGLSTIGTPAMGEKVIVIERRVDGGRRDQRSHSQHWYERAEHSSIVVFARHRLPID